MIFMASNLSTKVETVRKTQKLAALQMCSQIYMDRSIFGQNREYVNKQLVAEQPGILQE